MNSLTWLLLMWLNYHSSLAPTSWTIAHSGEAVTLICKIQDGSDLLYWFIQLPGQAPTALLYHHASGNRVSYFNNFGPRFSPSFDPFTRSSQLKIANVSVWDTGIYYCAVRKQGEMKFGTGTALTATAQGV